MVHPLMLLFVLWLPWNWSYLPTAMNANVWCHEAPPARYPERIAWYDGGIHIVGCQFDAETKRRYVHELDHYLVDHYDVGNWDYFVSLVRAESTGWNEHQRNTVEWIIVDGGGIELHADLPMLLEGKIPPALQAWYPWFALN